MALRFPVDEETPPEEKGGGLMNYGMVLAATAVMALVTYLPRMLPDGGN